MSAIRLPLLCAFAGGCLCSAVLFGVWRADGGGAAPAQLPSARSTEHVVIVVPQTDQAGEVTGDTGSSAAHAEPARVETAARGSDREGEPATKDVEDVANVLPTPGSSAVSDVLTDLEAAYRQRLIAAARAEAEAAPAPVAVNTASTRVEPPGEAATRAVEPIAPVTAPAPAPVAVAEAPSAPPVAAAPVIVAQNEVRPPDVHIGDVNQNTYNITNVRQGDVYVTQQLAMLQYMQFLGMASNGQNQQPTHVSRGIAQRPTSQFRQFPSTLTNPDNPWGFNFAPLNLVH